MNRIISSSRSIGGVSLSAGSRTPAQQPLRLAPRDRSIEIRQGEFISLLMLAALYAATREFVGPIGFDTVNFYGPLALMTILGSYAWRMARMNATSVWSALFWFRIATASYFGFGQVVPFILNSTSLSYLWFFYAPTPIELLKLNLIVVVGVICVLAGAGLFSRMMHPIPALTRSGATPDKLKQMRRLGILLLISGTVIKYSLVFPQAMGWTTEVLPGAIAMFGSLGLAGIYLMTLWSLTGRHTAAFITILLFVLLEMASGLVLMTKSETMIPLLVFLIALLSHRASLFRIAIAATSLVILFAVLVPVVSHGRNEVGALDSNRGDIDIVKRFELLSSYYDARTHYAAPEELQGGLLRMCYANVGAFLVDRFDAGIPGDSLDLILVVFIPRILWPEKPVINLGQQLSILVSGLELNAVGAGLFFESYWNLGWLGLPFLLVPFGTVLGGLSRYSLYIVRNGMWLHLPVLFMAMRIGLAIDDHYVGQVGTVVLLVALHMAATLGSRVLAPTRPQLVA